MGACLSSRRRVSETRMLPVTPDGEYIVHLTGRKSIIKKRMPQSGRFLGPMWT